MSFTFDTIPRELSVIVVLLLLPVSVVCIIASYKLKLCHEVTKERDRQSVI
jgi:hypothetical protein